MSMDRGTSGMDTGTSGEPTNLTPNHVIFSLRTERQWGRPRLARELHNHCLRQHISSPGEANIAKQIYRLETGRIKSPDDFYSRLYCDFFERDSHELFGEARTSGDISSNYSLRSHKFLPLYIGPAAAERVLEQSVPAEPEQWTDCRWIQLEHALGAAALYVWQCGVVTFHLVEDLTLNRVSDLAVWRQRTYPENMTWALQILSEHYKCGPLSDPYVLSAYWVESVPHDEPQLTTALRLLSMPRVLTGRGDEGRDHASRQAHAALVEQALMREGFDHADIIEFGTKGISAAYASWSGVVYHPIAPTRGLSEDELVACELSVQATWAYCDYIRREVEGGRDPIVVPQYGWRFLRGWQSRLMAERPQETSQHRAMREVIIATSGLKTRLTQAIETLKECGE